MENLWNKFRKRQKMEKESKWNPNNGDELKVRIQGKQASNKKIVSPIFILEGF